jgi:aspartyl-tRNA(Asn)/glutamyl-tRNA(Gln) amidotransferase subunit C
VIDIGMIDTDLIKHLGFLCRLELTDSEISKYISQIEEILAYLDTLDSLTLSHVEPVRSETSLAVLRKDNANAFEGDVSEVAKNKKDGFIKGPRMA